MLVLHDPPCCADRALTPGEERGGWANSAGRVALKDLEECGCEERSHAGDKEGALVWTGLGQAGLRKGRAGQSGTEREKISDEFMTYSNKQVVNFQILQQCFSA